MLLKKIEYFPYGLSKEADIFMIDRDMLNSACWKPQPVPSLDRGGGLRQWASNPFLVKPLIATETISNIQGNQKFQHEDDSNFMKVLDESRKEVQHPIHAKILSAKSTTRI